MLSFYFSKIRESKLIKAVNAFIYTPWYMLCVALVMAASNLFGLEFFAFYAYTLLGVYTVLFAPDCFPIAPMFCAGYMLFSIGNNPASDYGNTIFSKRANVIQLIVIVCVIIVILTARLVFELAVVRRRNKRMPALTWGFVALGAAYILAGMGTARYDGKELAYSVLQILSLCITYFYLYYTVDWERRNAGEAAMMLTAVGAGLLLEIVGMYLTPTAIAKIKNGTFIRDDLKCGWGIYNNMGGMMAMLLPAPFYLACAKKRGWLYLFVASFFMLGVIFTQSRGACLAGAATYLVGIIFTVIYTPKEKRKACLLSLGVIAVCILLIGGILLAWEDNPILGPMLGKGADDNGRFELYKSGLKTFLQSPILGTGFYGAIDAGIYQHAWKVIPDDFFIPPRYHNTVVQLLATGGVVALLAYLFHRFQTVLLAFKNPAPHKTFLGLCICAHLLASLLDCHVFNLGPGLTYGIILLCMEMLPQKKKEMKKIEEKKE